MVEYGIVNLVERQTDVYTDHAGPDVTGSDKNPTDRSRLHYGTDAYIPLRIEQRQVAEFEVRRLLPDN